VQSGKMSHKELKHSGMSFDSAAGMQNQWSGTLDDPKYEGVQVHPDGAPPGLFVVIGRGETVPKLTYIQAKAMYDSRNKDSTKAGEAKAEVLLQHIWDERMAAKDRSAQTEDV
jgi:hypothetical protein